MDQKTACRKSTNKKNPCLPKQDSSNIDGLRILARLIARAHASGSSPKPFLTQEQADPPNCDRSSLLPHPSTPSRH